MPQVFTTSWVRFGAVSARIFSVFKTSENVLAFFVATHHIHFCTVAPTSDNVPYQYRCYRQNKSQMNKNEVILKSYRFLSPSIMTTGRKIGIAAKAKAEEKKKKKKKKKIFLVLHYKNVCGV